MEELSFKEKVRQQLISSSRNYYRNLVKKDYVIYSKEFQYRTYYIVSAHEDNYLHLTGVKTFLNAKVFFEKCFSATLTEDDFEIGNKSNKGSIRRKMSVLNNAIQIFSTEGITVEEQFVKNRISCSFASADKTCTIGFTKTDVTKPQTVLKGHQLKNEIEVDFILSREKGKSDFETIEYNRLGMSIEECRQLLEL